METSKFPLGCLSHRSFVGTTVVGRKRIHQIAFSKIADQIRFRDMSCFCDNKLQGKPPPCSSQSDTFKKGNKINFTDQISEEHTTSINFNELLRSDLESDMDDFEKLEQLSRN